MGARENFFAARAGARIKDAVNWTREQIERMYWLRRLNLKTGRARWLKRALRDDLDQARGCSDAGYPLSDTLPLALFKRLAATLKRYQDGAHFRSGQVTRQGLHHQRRPVDLAAAEDLNAR